MRLEYLLLRDSLVEDDKETSLLKKAAKYFRYLSMIINDEC